MCAPADPRAEKPVLAWNVAHQTRAQLEAELEADLKFLQKNAAKTDPSTGSIFTHIPDHTNNIQTSAAKETMFPVEDDLYLFDAKVHFTDTWKAMEKLVDEGLVRHLGISNFNFAQIQELLRVGCEKYKPAVLQNEVHLYLQAKDMLDFCRAHGRGSGRTREHASLIMSGVFVVYFSGLLDTTEKPMWNGPNDVRTRREAKQVGLPHPLSGVHLRSSARIVVVNSADITISPPAMCSHTV